MCVNVNQFDKFYYRLHSNDLSRNAFNIFGDDSCQQMKTYSFVIYALTSCCSSFQITQKSVVFCCVTSSSLGEVQYHRFGATYCLPLQDRQMIYHIIPISHLYITNSVCLRLRRVSQY